MEFNTLSSTNTLSQSELDSIDLLVKLSEFKKLGEEIKNSNSFDSFFNVEDLYCKNLCTNLKKSLQLPINDKVNNNIDYIPPYNSGLNNSEPIIKNYYFTDLKKIKSFNYLEIIKDDIRNFRKLNDYQIKYIKNDLSDNEKNELFDEFNKLLESIATIL